MSVYKHYSQEELDLQYNNRSNAPGFEYHLQQWDSVSRIAENKYLLHKDIPYGGLIEEKLDIFPSKKPGSKTLVFIHGGYWYKHARSDFYLIAEAFHKYDITIVLVGYPLMPAFSMDQLVHSCRNAANWVQQHIQEYNGDPQQVYVTGHSAGGHLTAMTAVADPLLSSKHLPIKGICAISGLYELLPIHLCYVNTILQMDNTTANRNSPVHLKPLQDCRIVLAVGANESDEYLAQSRELFGKWSPGNPSELLEIENLDHFSILTSILDTSSVLHNAIRKLMQV